MTRRAVARVRKLAARIDAATPPHRDRTVDALRALAIGGVILGHWMVTALVLTPGHAGETLRDASPLAAMPALTPVSWVFQTLAIFFLVGGYAAARSYGGGYAAWVRRRLVRLSRPVAALAVVWALLGTGLYLGGVSGSTLHTTARVWAGRETRDWIRFVPHVHLLGLGFGQDPMAAGFGARIFGCGGGGHSGYFQPGGIAQRNLAYIALGDPAVVTR